MFVAFSKTARSLKAEDSYVWLFTVFFVALILASWAAWLLLGRVTIYAVSNAARLETAQAAHPVQSLYAGRVTASHLGLGRAVKQGDVLIELDANVQRLQLLEERMERKPLDAELQVLKREIESEERAMEEQQRAAEIGVEEARARLREAEAEAAYADLEVDRKSDLHEAGVISQLELACVT